MTWYLVKYRGQFYGFICLKWGATFLSGCISTVDLPSVSLNELFLVYLMPLSNCLSQENIK
jgi:hypothetical protein